MADNARLLYQLSQSESILWQQGGPAALALQQQVAEVHRQGGLGFAAFLDVFHPDGILAAQHTAPVPPLAQATVLQAQTPAVSRGEISAPVRDLGRAEGTLIETSTVTAYQMSANESAAWSRGDHEARMVEANIGDALRDVTTSQPVAVLLDDGRAIYGHRESLFQTLTASLSLLQDRMSALKDGVQVSMDFSVQFGKVQSPVQNSLDALEQRVEQLRQPTPQRVQDQGMSY